MSCARLGLALFVAMAVALVPMAQAEEWSVTEQPDLADALASAAMIEPEVVTDGPVAIEPRGDFMVPNPDGKSWDYGQFYIKDYRKKQTAYIVDLGTGEVRTQKFPEYEGRVNVHDTRWTLGYDGTLYGASPNWGKYHYGGGMVVFRYNADRNFIEPWTIIPHMGGERYPITTSPNGWIYGCGQYMTGYGREGSRHDMVGAYGLNPETGEVRLYAPIGPDHDGVTAYGYSLGVDDKYIYVASGKVPWYLLAVEMETGEVTVLAETEPGDYKTRMRVYDDWPGASAHVQKNDEAEKKFYWLWHGEMYEKTEGGTPPWEGADTPAPPWADNPPEPEIFKGQIDPEPDGTAHLWVKHVGAEEWTDYVLPDVERYPLEVHRIALMNDGRLFGSASGHKGRFLYNPATGERTDLGRDRSSLYAVVPYENLVYWSGYPSGPVMRFDPAKPWNRFAGATPEDPGPEATDPDANPRLMGRLIDDTRCKKIFHGTIAADGKIYFGGIGQRDYYGGSLGWFDPETDEMGGIWEPFSGHRIHWMELVDDGWTLLLGTHRDKDVLNDNEMPEQAYVFVYDIRTGEVTNRFPVIEGHHTTGPFLEVEPGLILGSTMQPMDENEDKGLFWGANWKTGEVLFTKKTPDRIPFGWSQGTSKWDYVWGPDKKIWTSLGDVLVRIDPETCGIEPLGRLPENGKYLFVGGDLYLTGTEELRVIRNAAQELPAK
jgi:hypothetical protein